MRKKTTSPEKREAWFIRHVDSQPPLTQAQRDRLAAIFGSLTRRTGPVFA